MIEGITYQATSGQWAWRISDEEGDICAGAGYDNEESAAEDMAEQLAFYTDGNEQ